MFKKFNKEFLIHNNRDDQYHPSIIQSSFSSSDFSVTWTNKEFDTTSTRIMLKHHNKTISLNASVTDLVAVNGDFATNRMHSKIAHLASGNTLMTWCSDRQDSSGYGIYATLLNKDGITLKEEFRINTHTASNQEYPAISALSNGDFAIVWHSLGQDTKEITSGIFAKVFNGAGDIVKEEFQVNDYIANNQDHPVIEVLDNGNYVIAWQSFKQDGSGRGVYAKIYDNTNTVIREEFRVNTHTANNQEFPTLSRLADNKFITVWQSNNQDGSGTGIYAKLFNSDGNIEKEEFRVNSYTENHQKSPTVTMLSDKTFIIAWQSQDQDGSGYGIYAQKYSQEANPTGEEFRVNDYTNNNQERPQVASLADGSCAIVWQSFGQDGYKSSVYGQIFTNENNLIYDQTNTHIPAVAITAAPTQISTAAPVIEEVTTESNATLAPTAEQPTLAPQAIPIATQISTISEIPTNAPVKVTTEGESLPKPQTTAVPVAIQISTEPVPTIAPLDSPTVYSAAPASTVGSTAASTNVPLPLTLVPVVNPTTLLTNTLVVLNTSSTSPIYGSEIGSNFIITSNVKEATIIAGAGIDNFIFEPSNNAVVYIDNFGSNDSLNLSNVTNTTSYAGLNKTSGSTHIHLLYNQTVVIKNKYPHELNDSNFVLQNSIINTPKNTESLPPNPPVGSSGRESSGNHSGTNSESNTNAVYLIAGVTVGAVALIGGAIACTVAGIIIYRHKQAGAAVSAKIAEMVAEHLPYGNEEEVSSSQVFSSSGSSVSVPQTPPEMALTGVVTEIG